MNRIIPLIGFIILAFQLNAQVVINEIMYNPPESGNDSLEYIEIYNAGVTDVDLTGYTMAGVEFTFPTHTLAADEYVVVSINPAALMNNFSVDAFAWTSGALKNGGEKVSLFDNVGDLVDEVEYMTSGGWPSTAEGAAGEGASIELCDPGMDNNTASNWNASSNSTGIIINDRDLRGTPKAPNSPCGPPTPDYIVQTEGFVFNPADITIGVGETVQWQNTGGTHNVNGTTDAYPGNPEGFTSGDPSGDLWTFQHSFTIAGVYDYHCNPHVGFGMKGTVTVISDVEPVDYPLYSIGLVTAVDANGSGDSLNVTCELQGVVYGNNLRAGGYAFTLIDENNDGIAVFLDSGVLPYTVAEGDEISVKGEISQFSGLLEIIPDSINMFSSGNTLFDPTTVTSLGEDSESQLVYLQNLSVKNAGDWEGDGTTFNITLTDGTNDIEMRVEDDIDLASMPLLGENFNLTGIGGQYDSSSPYDEGYQIFPRYAADMDVISSIKKIDIIEFEVFPNPSMDRIVIETDYAIRGLRIINEVGALLMEQKGDKRDVDVSNLLAGIYFVEIRTEEGSMGFHRFVKK